MALPTASTPGYGTITRNGTTYVGCLCLIRWLIAAERLGLARGLIKSNLDIVQLTGDVDASGGTHSLGAAFDVRQFSSEWSRLFREMGAAFWPRTGAAWAGNNHGHGFIACPHDAKVSYQRRPFDRGYSGLGKATSGIYAGLWGYASKDPDPWRPATRRTWEQGIAWAEAETRRLTASSTPSPLPAPSQEDDLTPEQSKQLADILTAVQGFRSEESGRYRVATGRFEWESGILRGIAAKVGAPVDEAAIAAAVLEGLAPMVSAAVDESVAAGVPTNLLADAVVERLGQRLAAPSA